MSLEIREETVAWLPEYARIPMAFEVRRILEVIAGDSWLGGLALKERTLPVPYAKDYDAAPGEGPGAWEGQFDLTHWGFLSARLEGNPVGAAAMAFNTPGVFLLEGRIDLSVLWDLRVSPEARGRGVGAALFRAAESWMASRGCRRLKVETQNVNVPACLFYASRGCELGSIHRFAYPGFPEEAQLLWYKEIAPTGSP